MSAILSFSLDSSLYLRDPQETELGRKIIGQSIELIADAGLDRLTFKKLAIDISSTEASVYRYFESKHQLMTYLSAWYWSWVEYLVEFKSANISDPETRLQIAIAALAQTGTDDPSTTYIDEAKLHSIVVAEFFRSYSSQLRANKAKDCQAMLSCYTSLCEKLAVIFREINSNYAAPKTLATTLVTLIQRQLFDTEYFPQVTNLKRPKGKTKAIEDFAYNLMIASLHHN